MRSNRLITIAVYVGLIFLSLVTIYPLFWIATVSVKSLREYMASPIALPRGIDLSNYVQVLFVDGRILRFLLNSAVVTSSSVVLTLLCAIPASYCLSRLKFAGRDLILLLFLFNLMIPLIVFMTPLYVLISRLGLTGSYWSIIFPYIASRLGISIFLLRAFFRMVPDAVEDAARLDGCDRFQTMWRVCVPAIRGGVMVVLILNFIEIWNEFFLAYVVLQNQEMFTLPAGLSVFRYQYSANWPYMSVALMISVIPSLALFYFCQDRLLEGWGYTSK